MLSEANNMLPRGKKKLQQFYLVVLTKDKKDNDRQKVLTEKELADPTIDKA